MGAFSSSPPVTEEIPWCLLFVSPAKAGVHNGWRRLGSPFPGLTVDRQDYWIRMIATSLTFVLVGGTRMRSLSWSKKW